MAEDLMVMDKGVQIWYKVVGRRAASIKDFTGNYVAALLDEIKDKEMLSVATSTLEPYVKRGSEETSLCGLEEDYWIQKRLVDFRALIKDYQVGPMNPIIVRLPAAPPVVVSRKDEIADTLTNIIKSVNHQSHMIEMAEVEEFQKRTLGSFYKNPLPFGTIVTKLYLPMLGQVLPDMEPTTGGGDGRKRKFSEIIQSDVTKTRGHHIVAMVARSGSGKTATVVHLAKKHFVIYVFCEALCAYSPEFSDSNYRILAQDILVMYSRLLAPVPNDDREEYMDALRSFDEQIKNLASQRVQLEFLARQLFLELLFRKNPQLTPEEFFREQLCNGSATIRLLINELRIYNPETIRAMLGYVEDHLRTFLTDRGLVIALDEAHIAETDCLHDRLISPSAIVNNVNFLDHKGQIRQDLRRGFLTPLCATLSDMRATLVVLGTRLILMDASHVYSAIAKPDTRFEKVTCFYSCDESHVEELLSKIINISDCTIQPEQKQLLSGRFRFVTSVFAEICKGEFSNTNKQARLNEVIDRAIKKAKDDVRMNIKTLLESRYAVMIKNLLGRMIIVYKLKGGKIAFMQQDEFDFVNGGVCALREDSDGYHWILEEPLVIEVLEEELKNLKFDVNALELLNMTVSIPGINSLSKGEVFQLMVYRALQRFNGRALADLPFIKDIPNLPEWCDTIILNVRKFGTAKELGYGNDNAWGDVRFFQETHGEELLILNNVTRPDGALLLDKEYGLSLAMNLYSQTVNKDKHELNKSSSNLRKCFMTTDNKVNQNVKHQQREFTKTAFYKLKGILRIHLEFPSVSGGTPTSEVIGQDIYVYIDRANMNTFFDESIEECSQDMNTLKKMLKYVWGE